jgi:cell division protease FtsH
VSPLDPSPTTLEPVAGAVRTYNSPLVRTFQATMVAYLVERGVPTTVDQQVTKRVASLATILLPSLVIVIIWVYLILSWRWGTGLFALRSKSRLVNRSDVTGVSFADVAGQEAAVAELREVQDFLADPARYKEIGAPIPKGILLYGPPGCGKTLLARALAGEAKASFFSVAGSDFVEMYAGVGAARVRDLFKEAREHAPAIVFIDELDAIGRSRADTMAPGRNTGEQEQALNQILTEMDGFASFEGVVVLGATNRPDVLDPALLRPGRFDRDIGLERPGEAARLAILQVHAAGKQLGLDVNLSAVAARSYGLTGADLANVMNEAALLAVRAGKPQITQAELAAALKRIMTAPERQRRLSLRSKSLGRRTNPDERVTFADVAGVDEVLAELREVRDYLARPDRYAAMGARIPRGVLLAGPPGCGKTLMARALAGEANAAFFDVAASEFVEVFVGVGASRVRDLFAEAAAVAPAIIFIDELDAVGAARSTVAYDSHREHDQTLNQILVELDGFQARAAVVVVGATNRPDILDAALTRPGRFDRQVTVSFPDRAGRRAILAVHARGKPWAQGVDLDVIAGLTRGFSGADLANVVNEAALAAVRRGHPEIQMADVEEGVDRAILGVARSHVMSDDERLVVAYHEAGHAVLGLALPGATPPHKVTLVARGDSLGHCTMLDDHDRVVVTRSRLIDRMAASLGGLVAEQMTWGEWTTGAASDLQRVGEIARSMVRDCGMSDVIGTISYPATARGFSQETDGLIDGEARRVADEALRRAQGVLGANRSTLDRVARALLERETLSEADLRQLWDQARTGEVVR